jgi:hypothetical protein
MAFHLFDYKSVQGRNDFKEWTAALQKKELGKLNVRLDMLARLGDDLMPNILTGTTQAGLMKLRVPGRVQLRPLLCRGPINTAQEYTLLMGATEVGMSFEPPNAVRVASQRRTAVTSDPDNRRCKHERVS